MGSREDEWQSKPTADECDVHDMENSSRLDNWIGSKMMRLFLQMFARNREIEPIAVRMMTMKCIVCFRKRKMWMASIYFLMGSKQCIRSSGGDHDAWMPLCILPERVESFWWELVDCIRKRSISLG